MNRLYVFFKKHIPMTLSVVAIVLAVLILAIMATIMALVPETRQGIADFFALLGARTASFFRLFLEPFRQTFVGSPDGFIAIVVFVIIALSTIFFLVRVISDSKKERKEKQALQEERKKISRGIDDSLEKYEQRINELEQNKNVQEQEIRRLKDEKDAFFAKNKLRLIQLENVGGSQEYFRISKFHVRLSFVFSIIACAIGLLLLVAAVFRSIANQDFKSALIPTISATVAELIAATVFWVHRKSAEQLNHYYDSLHEIEVFLSTMDVIDQISSENRDAAYQKVLDELFNIQKIKAAKPGKHAPKPEDKEG